MTFSPTRPQPFAHDPAAQPLAEAIGAVAERSFFALVDPCGEPPADAGPASWLVSTVRFDDGVVSGSIACWLPPELARHLFDAFSGRDPIAPEPPAHELYDLVGEFSNMVCGDWLSRCLGQRVFQLSPPLVVRGPRPAGGAPRRWWMKINGAPLAVDWNMTAMASGDPRDLG